MFCLLYGSALIIICDHWKDHSLVGRVMSLLFNTLSRFVVAFLSRSSCLLILWLQSPSTVILEPKKRNLSLFPRFPLLFAFAVMGPDAMILIFLNI